MQQILAKTAPVREVGLTSSGLIEHLADDLTQSMHGERPQKRVESALTRAVGFSHRLAQKAQICEQLLKKVSLEIVKNSQ